MATRHCGALGLPLLLLVFFVSVPAIAELRPVKVWRCTIAALDPGPGTEGPPDRAITLYEYRSLENCLDDALPPDGSDLCRTEYTKDGATETLWRARNNRDYCRPRTKALIQDLVSAGFFCTALDNEGCEVPAAILGDDTPIVDAQPVTEATSAIRNTAPIDKAGSREKRLLTFFDGLFDASLANAMTKAAIPADFDVFDGNTLATGDGATLRFTRGTHAWETRRDKGVLVINADFQRGQSFNDVFFGFAFDRSDAMNESARHQIGYLGVVSPETSSEVIFAGEDKIIISSKWFAESSDCLSSQTTDEYQWSDSIYGTQRVRRISADDNPDCAER